VLERITGTVVAVADRAIVVSTGGLGISIFSPRPAALTLKSEITLFTHMAWSQDKGPALYGFLSEHEREIFCMIISCPKIGPSIGLQILSQTTASQFINMVSRADVKGLSSLNGLGAKKASQIVNDLQERCAQLAAAGVVEGDEQSTGSFGEVLLALESLGYSRQEATDALKHAGDLCDGSSPFDKVMRAALGYLTKKSG
jgi:Holliday junction DNA helicase RuvA